VFVVARGPKTAYRDTGNMESSAVFASGDGGATWALSSQSGGNAASVLVETLSLSPGFATDQTVQATGHRSGTAPSTFGCTTALSNDAGGSWTMLSVGQTPGLSSQTGVCGVGLLLVNGAGVVIGATLPYYLSGGYMQLLRSLDYGVTWLSFNPPGDNLFAGLRRVTGRGCHSSWSAAGRHSARGLVGVRGPTTLRGPAQPRFCLALARSVSPSRP
jgi:hypothetical protein